MITSFFLNIFYSFVSFIISLFPTGSLDPNILLGFQYVVGSIKFMNYIVPLDTAFHLVLVGLAIRLILANLALFIRGTHFITGRNRGI